MRPPPCSPSPISHPISSSLPGFLLIPPISSVCIPRSSPSVSPVGMAFRTSPVALRETVTSRGLWLSRAWGRELRGKEGILRTCPPLHLQVSLLLPWESPWGTDSYKGTVGGGLGVPSPQGAYPTSRWVAHKEVFEQETSFLSFFFFF